MQLHKHFLPTVGASSSVHEEVQSVDGCSADESDALKSLASMRALAAAAAPAQDVNDGSDVASSASCVAAQEEPSDEESACSAHDPDATNLFHLETESCAASEAPRDKDKRVARLLASQVRRRPLVPAQPGDDTGATSFTAVGTGSKLPAAHCAFRGCCWIGTTTGSIEEHVVRKHGN